MLAYLPGIAGGSDLENKEDEKNIQSSSKNTRPRLTEKNTFVNYLSVTFI